jgi:predicted MFS family arabinose efflux permease
LNEILRGGLAVRVFLCFAAGLLLSYALRSINAVIAPSLVAEFGLSNAELGALASAYFLSFAILQLPLGVWLDRFGSRRTNALLLTIAALGCLCFALSTTSWMLWLSRALIGVGVCGALMAALRAFRFWYAPERQQQLAAWILVAGSLGALTATVPVHALLPHIGWRGVFMMTAVLLAGVAAALWWALPAEPRQPVQTLASQWGGYLQVFGEPYFWRYVIPLMMVQSSFIAFQGLWAGPWFVNVLGMDPAGSAQALFVMNLLLMSTYLLFGAVLPGWVRRGWTVPRLVAWGGLLMLLSLTAISLASGPWAWLLWLPLAIGSTTFMITQSHLSLTFPPELTGRAFSASNLMMFVGMFLTQWLFGVVIDLIAGIAAIGPGAPAYRAAMAVWVALQVLAYLLMIGWRVRPREAAQASEDMQRP